MKREYNLWVIHQRIASKETCFGVETWNISIVDVYLYVYILPYSYTFMPIYLCVHIHLSLCVYTTMCIYHYVYIPVCVYIYMCIYLYVYIPLCIYTFMYTYLYVCLQFDCSAPLLLTISVNYCRHLLHRQYRIIIIIMFKSWSIYRKRLPPTMTSLLNTVHCVYRMTTFVNCNKYSHWTTSICLSYILSEGIQTGIIVYHTVNRVL